MVYVYRRYLGRDEKVSSAYEEASAAAAEHVEKDAVPESRTISLFIGSSPQLLLLSDPDSNIESGCCC